VIFRIADRTGYYIVELNLLGRPAEDSWGLGGLWRLTVSVERHDLRQKAGQHRLLPWIHDQTLYKILTGAIEAHRITPAWDEVVRLVASMCARVVSPSSARLRLGSYARRNRIHQALAEIGRIHKTTSGLG
jgi:hypothetical protein